MAEMTEYAPGTPCWVDLASPDLEASKAFYGKLLGWEAEPVPDPSAGGYTMFLLNGKYVAGLGPIFGEGQPPAWSTYVATSDVDASVKAVGEAGGKVIAGPMDVFQAGRMAVFQDSTGAYVSVWQAGEHKGAQLANERGTFAWNELYTRDLTAAKAFYRKVFGWDAADMEIAPGRSYTTWKLDGRDIGGAMDMSSVQMPESVPPHWLPYFVVPSVDEAVTTTQSSGGNVMMPGTDIPNVGRIAVLADPQGAAFALFQM